MIPVIDEAPDNMFHSMAQNEVDKVEEEVDDERYVTEQPVIARNIDEDDEEL